MGRLEGVLVTLSLEDQAQRLRIKIHEQQEQLEDIERRIHKRRVKETGLVGRKATSHRVPLGIIIDDVTFKTWAPAEPQSVSGYRTGGAAGIYTTIHLTSPEFQFHDADPASISA
jgi:hypothetical protein